MIPHVDRPMVYIAGPFTSNPMAGTRNAVKAAERLDQTGLIMPVVPHLNLLWDLICGHEEQFWLDMDLAYLNRCNALYRLPGISPGADGEVAFAEENSIEVFYETGELLAWAETFGAS